MADTQTNGLEVLETREWLDSLDYVLSKGGPERAGRLLQQLSLHARREAGVNLPFSATTPYQNTIPSRQQVPFPGSQEMERRIKSLVRWNAMAMVVRQNKYDAGFMWFSYGDPDVLRTIFHSANIGAFNRARSGQPFYSGPGRHAFCYRSLERPGELDNYLYRRYPRKRLSLFPGLNSARRQGTILSRPGSIPEAGTVTSLRGAIEFGRGQ